MSGDVAIATRSLTKRYPQVTAVEGLNLSVRRGEIYGFLGLNGAGKTTTIRMMLGLIRPSAGEVHVLGVRVEPGRSAFLGRVGCLIESATAYPNLTVRENLAIQQRLMRAPKSAVAEAIDLLRLGAYASRPAGHLSLGNKQRLSLARALLHHPDLVILDEPANGLDPAGIVEIRELLLHLAKDRGTTIFMSSHILIEVAHLADRIGIVHRGRLIEEMGRHELAAKGRNYLEVHAPSPDDALTVLARAGFRDIEPMPGGLRLPAERERTPEVAQALLREGIRFTAIGPVKEDLERYFLHLTEGDG